MKKTARPTPEDLAAAIHKTVQEVLAPELRLLFCGINPGLYSAATGFNFARPGNRFWPTLHKAGLTPELLEASEQERLLEFGLGITNLVTRSTAKASELTREELLAGRLRLEQTVAAWRPRVVAVLGVSAYREAFARPRSTLGLQAETLAGTPVWVLPNPSGLNAHFQLPELARLFRECADYAEALAPATDSWRLLRQDDNGNVFVIKSGLSHAAALHEAKRYTALGHKQLYWAEPEA